MDIVPEKLFKEDIDMAKMANLFNAAMKEELREIVSDCFDSVRNDITEEDIEFFEKETIKYLATEFVEAINNADDEAEMMEIFLKTCGILAIPVIKRSEKKGVDLESFIVDSALGFIGKHIDDMCDELGEELERNYDIKEKDPV